MDWFLTGLIFITRVGPMHTQSALRTHLTKVQPSPQTNHIEVGVYIRHVHLLLGLTCLKTTSRFEEYRQRCFPPCSTMMASLGTFPLNLSLSQSRRRLSTKSDMGMERQLGPMEKAGLWKGHGYGLYGTAQERPPSS